MTPTLRYAIVLGLLSALGPFAIDMYLPALPAIATDLHTPAALAQTTLIAFFLSFGLCQLAYGPWSDVAGRKLPLYSGLGLFFIGGAGCGLASSVGSLIAFRVLQGIGAACVTVIPRAIVRDLHTGPEATRLMALIMLVFSVSPILAPLCGSGLILAFGWRSVFAAMTLSAVAGFVLIAVALPETRPGHARGEASWMHAVRGFGLLLSDVRFMGLTCTGGLGLASFFVFLANSSFVYIGHFGLSSTQYSVAFSINAIGFIGSSQFTSSLAQRFGMTSTILAAASSYAFFALLLFGSVALGANSLPLLIGLLFYTFACLGLVIPATTVLSLENHGAIAGAAAALGGTLQMMIGAIFMALASVFFDGTQGPMVSLIAICALGTVAFALATLLNRSRTPVNQAL